MTKEKEKEIVQVIANAIMIEKADSISKIMEIRGMDDKEAERFMDRIFKALISEKN